MKYTEQDVRNYYGDYSDELNSEQIHAIANTWEAIDTLMTYKAGSMPDDDRTTLTENLVAVTAQIIDGTTTVEKLKERYLRAQIAYLKESSAYKIAQLAQKALIDKIDVNKLMLIQILEDESEEIKETLRGMGVEI